jgi:PTH1 family peptidyl-tRNA hydrolase
MLLIVGLGNPGLVYERHRHNIGFMAIDALAAAHGFGPWRRKYAGQLSEGQLNGEKVLLQKPETFMNRSGQAVASAVHFFKLPLNDLVVLHDELDLAAGKVRIKAGGGVAGHNGLRSIAESLGSTAFRRARFGIGHPGHKELVTGHVLGNFSNDDQAWLNPVLAAFAAAAPLLAKGDDAGCMNKIALLTQPPKPVRPKAGGKAIGEAPEN